MSPTLPSHPSSDRIVAFGLGRLPDEESDEIAAHLDRCDPCARVLDGLPADPFLAALRGAAQPHPVTTPNRSLDPTGPLGRAAPTPTPDDLPAVPGYEVLGVLGRGGMGVVYKARQVRADRVVALKLIRSGDHASGEERERFRTEAAAVARLSHPQVVQVFDVGEHGGRPFFSLEYCPDGTLADRLAGDPLPPRDAAALVGKLAAGVHAAHQGGVVHRDLKPANVLLAGGEPKVTDFGLARLLDAAADVTRTGAVMGTPSYMAPEQAAGDARRVGPAADVWALGAILYECLTGRPPFKGATPLDTLDQVRTADPVPVRHLVPGVPRDLETVCLKCLEKDAHRRYPSAAALGADLRAFLKGRPVAARPVGVTGRLGRWVRRNPRLAAAVGVAVVALVGGTVTSTALAGWALESARDARAHAGRADERAEAARRATAAAEEAAGNERAAKVAAQAQTRLAEARVAQRNRALELMAGAFHDLDPKSEERQGKPLRALLGEQLDQATAALTREALGDPLDVADLQWLLGDAHNGLGRADRAEPLLVRAARTFEQRLGPDHQRTLNAQTALASAVRAAGRPAEAIPVLERILAKEQGTLGPAHPTTLTTLANLAATYWSLGRFDRSIPLFEQALEGRRATLGPADRATLKTQALLGMNYSAAGRPGEGVRLLTASLEGWEAISEPEHPDALEALNNLAAAYWSAGRSDRAVPLFEKAVARERARLGPDHPHTLKTLMNLGVNYRDSGRGEEGLALLEQAAGRYAATLGPDHPETLFARNNLAATYWRLGRLDRSVPLLETTLEKQRATLGDDHPHTLLTMANLGVNYWSAGRRADGLARLEESWTRIERRAGPVPADLRWVPTNLAFMFDQVGLDAKAEPLLRAFYDQARARFGADHPETAGRAAELGSNLLRQKKFAAADPPLRAAMAFRARSQPDAWVTFNTGSMLGEALYGQGKPDAAGPMILTGYRGLKARSLQIPPEVRRERLEEALDRLIRYTELAGAPGEVEQWRAERAGLPPGLAPAPRPVR